MQRIKKDFLPDSIIKGVIKMGKFLKKYKKLLSIPILSVLMMFSFMNDVSAASKESLSWSVVIDDTTNQLNGYVIEDSGTKALEIMTATSGTNCSYVKVAVSDIVTITSGNSSCKIYQSDSSRETLAWTFPPVKGINWGGSDKDQAEEVNEVLVTSFNTAISKIIVGNDLTFGTKQAFPALLAYIANSAQDASNKNGWKPYSESIKNANNEDQVFTFFKKNVTKEEIEKAGYDLNDTGPSKGWDKNSFIKLSVTSDHKDAVILPYRFPKGYATGQNLAGMLQSENGEAVSYMPEYLSWSHMAYQASSTYLTQNIDASNTDKLFGNSATGSDVETWLSNAVSSFRGFIGIYSIEELSLNRGTRGSTYYKGIMPNSWFTGISLIYWFFQIIAIFVMGSSFIKLMIEKNISVINPGKRVEIMDGLMNLFYSVIMMIMFIPFFTLLATVNEVFVEAMAAMVPAGSEIAKALANNSIIGIIINIVFLFIMCKVNITYIIRAITIGILYATAPIFISMYSFGEGGKQRFETWIKELVVNIFLQSFNAIMTVIFIMTFKYSTARIIEQIALTLSYVALSDYFKNTLLDASSGNDRIDDTATGVLGTAFGTAAAGTIAGVTNWFGRGAMSHNTNKNNNRQSIGASNTEGLNSFSTNTNSSIASSMKGESIADRGGIPVTKLPEKMQGEDRWMYRARTKRNDAKANQEMTSAMATSPEGVVERKNMLKKDALIRGAANAVGATAMAGVSMGMEAIGAKSFEANRRLAQMTGAMMSNPSRLFDEYDSVDSAYEDYIMQEEMERQKQQDEVSRLEAKQVDNRKSVEMTSSTLDNMGIDYAFNVDMDDAYEKSFYFNSEDEAAFKENEISNMNAIGYKFNVSDEQKLDIHNTYKAQAIEMGVSEDNYVGRWVKDKKTGNDVYLQGTANNDMRYDKVSREKTIRDKKGNESTERYNNLTTPKGNRVVPLLNR